MAHIKTHAHFIPKNFRKCRVVFKILVKEHYVYLLLQTTVYKYLVIEYDEIL